MQKFTDKYIFNWEILSNAIVGFELEFYTNKSYYVLLTLLNEYLDPIKVHGFRNYHSKMKTDENNFKIEPDLSGGDDMVELITGPMSYNDSKIILLKILKFMRMYTQTTDKCSLHINISFEDKDIVKLNPLKIIINVDEDYIYKLFPDRKNNYYATSVKNMIPYKDYDFVKNDLKMIENNIEYSDSKYKGINISTITKGRLEFRYIGGKDYHLKTKEIIELLDYFIILTYNSIDDVITSDEKKKLYSYLSDNISNFKHFKNLDNFIAEFPSIKLKVDKDDTYSILKSYYNKIYNTIYDLIHNIDNLKDCIINYDTDSNKIEVVDANFKGILEIMGIRFINCNISNGIFTNCEFIDTEISDTHLYKCEIKSTEVYNTKLEGCKVDQTSILINCYFANGLLDGNMTSGIFRSGKIGQFGYLDNDVEIVSGKNYFYNKNTDNTSTKKMSKK
jgi:hypothetical protein